MQQFGNDGPNEIPRAVIFLFQTDHGGVSKSYWAAIRRAGKKQGSQSFEVGQVSDNKQIVGIHLQEICGGNRVIFRSQSRRVTGPGCAGYVTGEDVGEEGGSESEN